MNPFRKRMHRAFFEENKDGGAWGTTDSENKTPDSEAGKEDKKEDNSIPYERFKEVNDRMKTAEAELQKYKEAETKKAEEESIKKWEYEKVISQKDQEIASLKKEQETWKARETAVSERNTQRMADLEKKFGDKWNDVKVLVDDISDPFTLSSKLDSLDKMSATTTSKAPEWWSKIPWGSSESRKEELMKKAESWRLTAKERTELLQYANAEK